MRLTPMFLALTLAACGGGLNTKLCGATGQPCCASNGCDPGAVCGAGQLCEACGADGQQCCAMGACNASLACGSGVCGAALSCETLCTLGASRCQNNGIETCAPMGVCPAWKTTLSMCPSGSTCQLNGATADCVEACPGACTPGTQLCSTGGLRQCVASGSCPTLEARADNSDQPVCATGASISPELAWESPTPMGNDVVDIAGDLASSYWVLDSLGNVFHYAVGPWEQELAVTPGKEMQHLASCNLGSRLYAAGRNGTVYRRAAAMWTEENVGSTTALVDIACDSNRAYAIGADGKLYVRTGLTAGTWTSYATGATQPLTGVAELVGTQELFLSGRAGTIIRCDVNALPPACAPENSRNAANLTAIWADSAADIVFAVGEGGTYLQRGALWDTLPIAEIGTDSFVSISGFHDSSNGTWQVALTSTGKVFHRMNDEPGTVTQLPDTQYLATVWAPNENVVLVGGPSGALWFRAGVLNVNEPFIARGGRKPLSEDLYAVTSVGQGRLFAVGANGVRAQRLNDTWTLDQLGAPTTANLYGVAARSAGEVYAVGSSGTVLVRRFGTWTVEAEGVTSETLVAVVLDDAHVWALGQTLLLQKSLSTGVWTTIPLPSATRQVFSMAMRTNAQGHAVELVVGGENCGVLSWVPDTGVFTPGGCAQDHTFFGAAFNSAGDLFLASDRGAIVHRVGTNFEQESSGGTLETFFALVPDGTTVWALSVNGALYRRSGVAWANTTPNVTNHSLLAGVKDDSGLYVVGTAGTVLRRQ